jgi:hypothetical protein
MWGILQMARWHSRSSWHEYPLDLNPATCLLFEEATWTYALLLPQEVSTYVTVEDSQAADEGADWVFILGLHFGHHAASFCNDLSALHASKLSLVAQKGVPLSRWKHGLMVLLEKIVGNVFVHKLHAISLLEADFNWWNKLVFAKRMMQQAMSDGSIPQECFVKKHSHCNNAVLMKQVL